jgi:hypothetical protein
LELEKAAEHGAQHSVKIKKMWDSPDGYEEPDIIGIGKTAVQQNGADRPILQPIGSRRSRIVQWQEGGIKLLSGIVIVENLKNIYRHQPNLSVSGGS